MAEARAISSASLVFLQYLLLLLLLFVFCPVNLVFSRAPITSLPGFDGPLPFQLETGYIGMETSDVQLFYYFVKSTRNPKKDPVILWLTGGPGCSGLSGLLFETGPLRLVYAKYNGSVPSLVLNPYSWTQIASIIFLDAPVGTGYSYARSSEGYKTGDLKSCNQTYQFLRKWLMKHPEFLSNPFYVGGDSYSGKTIPLVVLHISDGNKAGNKPFINLEDYIALLSDYWANNPSVHRALHIVPGSVEEWQRCNYDLPYEYGIQSSFGFHVQLSKRGYRSLIYNGDHDMLVPFSSTQAWIRALNYSIIDDWRPWFVDGQVGGYTRTYSNNMTFATVKGAGHTAPEVRPKECFAMFKRWISNEYL